MSADFQSYQCPGCGYVYDEARGEVEQGLVPGTRWARVPQDWCCPTCFVREKPDFLALSAPSNRQAGLRA